MEQPQEVKKLAETLKDSGIAASMMDAINKARSILGLSNKERSEPVVNLATQKPEHKEKVDEIIKEVDEEINMAKESSNESEEVKDQENQTSLNETKIEEKNDSEIVVEKKDDGILNSNMTLNELAGNEEEPEIITNDKETLKQQKQANQPMQNLGEMPQENTAEPSGPQGSIVMTNEELDEDDDSEKQENNENSSEDKKDESNQAAEESNSGLSEKEKSDTDLSKIFNYSK
jgi:hypothetical protein